MNDLQPDLTPELIRAYDRPGPRYTSYPTADRFHDGFTAADYGAALARANAERPGAPLSVYAHLPFCEQLCNYCGCHVVVSRSDTTRARYLAQLLREITHVAERLPERRAVAQLHLGGGTPNSYDDASLSALMEGLRRSFELLPGAEVAIEIDPRHASPARVGHLAGLGFNRLSMGVQDLDPAVQEAIGRVCAPARVAELVGAARSEGFGSVNLDLIYGLPRQTAEGFERTLDAVLAMRPDRVALYSFAWVPWAKPHQRAIDPGELPGADAKLALFCASRRAFLDAGYQAIGMDHFALPGDELATAQRAGRLRRNFQGYTATSVDEVVAFGASAIGDVGGAYAQNARGLRDYYRALDAGELPTARGYRRTADDAVRRYIIEELMTNLRLDAAALEDRFGVGLFGAFDAECRHLRSSEELRPLVDVGSTGLRLTPLGRLFVRNVARCFDRHLAEASRQEQGRPLYSRMV